MLTRWTFDQAPIVGQAIVAALYLFAARRLRSPGVAWSTGPCVLRLFGLLLLLIGTYSALSDYHGALLTAHAVQKWC